MEIRPHSGPQADFLSSPADIVVYGGAAGGGKTWGLVAEAVRHTGVGGYRGMIFRRTGTQVRNPGGLWDEALKLYPSIGGESREYLMEWKFPSGAEVKFAHLEHEKDKLNYQGGQFAFIGFDELTHFTEGQFWYLLSRNRSVSGVRPYIRATCNPDADSWVADLIAWYIDPETGYAILERSGVVRWFYRVNDRTEWFESQEAAELAHPELAVLARPKSFTFIPARLDDNPTLIAADPGYRANLMAMPLVDRERLLGGNWKIRPTAGNFFRLEWLQRRVDAIPRKGRFVRYWDKAGGETESSDRSVGLLMNENEGVLTVCDAVIGRWSPHQRNEIILNTAEDDKRYGNVDLWIEDEPGHNAKEVRTIHARKFAAYAPRFDKPTTNKSVRAKPFAAQCEAGNVQFVRNTRWLKDVIDELHGFPPPEDNGHDDAVDACSGAANKLLRVDKPSTWLPVGHVSKVGR